MAFFKFRKGGDESLSPSPKPESVEAMRQRARHRLTGAAVLVLLAVVGFPVLFDTQPRPIASDIPIEIPDRNKARPLPAPPGAAAPAAERPEAPAAVPPAEEKTAAAPALPEPPALKPQAAPEPKPPTRTAAPAPSRPDPPSDTKPAAKAAPEPGEGAKARALLEGKSEDGEAAAAGRFVVQVGAFADPAKARETRLKVERSGLKTYTHVAETKDGRRIRVRVGPFSTRADADNAAGKLKRLDLPAAVLTL